MIYNTCNNLIGLSDLQEYLSSDLINEIYLKPKKVNQELISEKLKDTEYVSKFNSTIKAYKNVDIEKIISDKISAFELDMSYKLDDYNIYIIIGLDTTTIYSIKFNGKDVTVLLLEATNGDMDQLDMLLAHEFTHFVRKQIFKRDIFENSIGERFVVEGIGCNYSREIVPNKEEFEYCIVNRETVNWVNNNLDKIELYMKGQMETNKLMSDFFYMFADTEKTGIPARTGYVYGYLKVKEYLEKNGLKVKDIIKKEWKDILLIQANQD